MKAQIRLEVEVGDDDDLVGLADAVLDLATERGVPAGASASWDGNAGIYLAYNDLSVDLARQREEGVSGA